MQRRLAVLTALALAGFFAGTARAPAAGFDLVQEAALPEAADEPHLAVSPDGRHLYVAHRLASGGFDGRLSVLDIQFGGLSLVETHSFTGQAYGLAVSPDGLHVYVSRYGFEMFSVYGRDAGTGALTLIDDTGAGLPARLRAYRQIQFGPDGRAYIGYTTFLFAVGGGVAVATRDPGTGLLTAIQFAEVGGDAPGTIGSALSHDATRVYAVSPPQVYSAGLLSVLSRDPTTGLLTVLQSIRHSQPELALGDPRTLQITEDDAYVYVANRSDDTVSIFARDVATGELALLQVVEHDVGEVSHLAGPTTLAVLPSDGTVLVGTSAGITAFRRGASGDLGHVGFFPDALDGRPDFPGAPGFLLTDDGRLFAAGPHVAEIQWNDFCDPTPRAGCRTGGKGKLSLRDRGIDTRDFFSWLWAKGEATTLAEFDGEAAHDFAACLYANADDDPGLVLRVAVPQGGICPKSSPKPCWTLSTTTAKYKDPDATPDGASKAILGSGDEGRAKIKITGTKRLQMPALPPTLPAVLQLQSSSGPCWESRFSTAKTATSSTFKAVADLP